MSMVPFMPSHLSIKTRISMTFVLLGAILLCGIAFFTCRYSRAELKRNISSQQTTLVNTLAAQLDDRLFLILGQQLRFAAAIDASILTDPRRLQSLLNGEKELRLFFNDGMMCVNRSGKILAEYPLIPERNSSLQPKEYEYVRETVAGGKPVVSSPYKSSLSGEPVVAFSAPVLDRSGKVTAILIGRHRLWSAGFLNDLVKTRIGRNGYLCLVDKRRNLIVFPDKSRVAEQVRVGGNLGLEQALNGFEGVVENVNSRGLSGLSAFKQLHSVPWILASSYPLSEAYQPIDSAIRDFLLTVLAAGLVSTFVIAWVVQRITRPLLLLTGHVGSIATREGDDRLFPVQSQDEIGTLARVFNSMITELDERQRRLDEEMAFVESLVMNSAAPIFVLGRDHRIIYWNKALEALTGFAASEMTGSDRQWEPFYNEKRPTLADVVLDSAEETLPVLYEKFRPSRLVENAFHGEGWYVFKTTGRRYLILQASPLLSSNGEVTGVVETLVDLTDAKQIEEMLNDQYRFLQEIIDAIPNPVHYKDLLGRHVGCNRAYEAFYGRSREDILGKTLQELASDSHLIEHERVDRECLCQATLQMYESVLVHTDGKEHDVIITKAPFYDKNGNVAGLVGTSIDISDRKLAEQALADSKMALEEKHAELSKLFAIVESSRHEWEDTMDSLSEMVLICDHWGIIRRCNRAISEFAQLSYEQILGMECMELLGRIGMDMSDFDGKCGHLLFDNGQRHFELLSSTLKQVGEDTIRGVVVTIHETTELFRVNEELQKAYDELQQTEMKVFQQEKLASIGQLAAGVAHEINNPMGFISSNLASLGKYQERINEFITTLSAKLGESGSAANVGEVAEQRKRLKMDYILEDIPQLIAESLEGAQRVRKIVQDLKSFSRVDESEHKRVDINECLDSTINIVWNEIKYVATLEREYGDIPPLLCYPQQINQVFMNLLVNAAHAIEGKGVIRVRTWREGDSLCVAVSDTGCGIAPEIQKRIFEPFFTTKEVGKGTGLGLSISYDIIRKHQGDIVVESEPGKGSTFTVKLPLST